MHKEITSFFNEITRVYNSNLPFVVYRKPNENNITAFVQQTKELCVLNSFKEEGFVFAPFYKNETNVLFPIEKCDKFTTETSDKANFDIKTNNSNFEVVYNEYSKENHIQLVKKGIDFITANKAKKIVLSRKETVNCEGFEVVNTLKKMLIGYKSAFVYVWFHPSVGLWMGATPERLVNVKDTKFETMALAGTQVYKNTVNVSWKEKEKQEQQFVTDYILETIKKCIKNIKVSEPCSIKAGNLLHIRTTISGELKSPNLLEELIKSLHPTPAVCGLPKNKATKFILENEKYNRAYYSGYLGELNMSNETNLFVNLRCMQLTDNVASIYIGGGITIDSVPENEWEETVAKAEVMKRVL